MAEKNQETEKAFMDELSEAIGTSQSVSFHLLIRRVRRPYRVGESARGYAWNIRDIIGHDENLMRRFLESVPLPRAVEEILSDPFYDYKGDRGESVFWGLGRPRYITDAQRAEMRRRRPGGWIAEPPAKRIVVKKDDPKKKAEGKAGDLHQPSTSKAFQSGNQSLPSCSTGGKKKEHSRNTSESVPAKRIVKKDDPKKDEYQAHGVHRKVQPGTSKGFQTDNKSFASCSKGGKKRELSRNTPESAPSKRIVKKDDPKKNENEAGEVRQMVVLGTSKYLKIDNQAIPSCSKKGENSRNTPESAPAKRIVKKDDRMKDENQAGEMHQKVVHDTSKALKIENQALPPFSKGEVSRNTPESAPAKRIVKMDDSKNDEDEAGEQLQKVVDGTSKALEIDNQALPSSKGGKKGDHSKNSFESTIKNTSGDDEKFLLGVEFDESRSVNNTNQITQSCSKDKNTDVNSNSSESAKQEGNRGDDEQDLDGGSSGNSEIFYVENYDIPSCSGVGVNTPGNLNVSSELVKEDFSKDDWEGLPEVDSNNEARHFSSEDEETGEHSGDFPESANEDSIEDEGSEILETETESETSEDSYCDDQIVPEYKETDDSSASSEF